ncbi:MAG: UDP-N-acetylmuramoyl-L-alanine--D-glutamate ligase [Caldisericaceae bacterium]|nr:UDP-N-acetylmuramoyl-L-alanine--D-glutamate ligase [Caldisericaceae bacterium]RLD20814.1 MAG: UDP-N-acetylmuramoyl-L-alanine--D-glutamate ligase [Caldisericota bacterium]
MKKILIVGARKSGIYAALLAKKQGFEPFVTENSDGNEFEKPKIMLRKNNIEFEFGIHSFDKIKNFEMAVISPGVPLQTKIVKEIEKYRIPYIGEMEFAYKTTSTTQIISITGTNGKSTTTALTGNIFYYAPYNSITGGNLGTPYSELLLNNPNPDIAILETSCFQLETIEDFHPKVSVFLNFSEDHLNRYKDMEEYLKYKKRIFKNQISTDFAVLNADDAISKRLEKDINSKIFYFSRTTPVRKGVFLENNKIIFKNEEKEEEIISIESIRLLGKHNISNVLAAILSAKLLKIDNETIKKGIETFEGLPHRLEKVRELDGVSYINDSKATTPDSTIQALNAFHSKIILIAGGSSKNNDFTELARLFPNKLRKLVVTGETAAEIANNAIDQGFNNIVFASTLEKAVELAKKIAHQGDTILLSPACASFDMFKDFEDRGDKFKKIVNSL